MKFLTYSLLIATTSLLAEDYADYCCHDDHDEWNLFVHRQEFFANAEFLYWTVDEGAMDFAIKMNHAAWGPTPASAQGDYELAKYDWRPGFRVALGFYREPHYWEILGQYTWLYNEGNNHVSKPSSADKFLNSTWHIFTPGPLAEAKSHVSLHYHIGDLLVSRVFDPNPHLRLRLYGGATMAYIQQKWKFEYADFGVNADHIKNKWRYFGGGIRLGLGIDWFWTYQFYFTGKMTLATLMGSYENTAYQLTNVNPGGLNNPAIAVRDAKYKDHRFAFQAQFLLGPSWQRVFDCAAVELFAGYEFNIWLNVHEVFRSTQSDPSGIKETRMENGVFGLQGLTARLTVGF